MPKKGAKPSLQPIGAAGSAIRRLPPGEAGGNRCRSAPWLTGPGPCASRFPAQGGGHVIGAGPIGLLAFQVLKGKGAARIFVSDRDPERLKMAADLGADVVDARTQDAVRIVRDATAGLGAAVTLDAVGSAPTRKQGVQVTRAAGTLLLSGLHEEESAFPAAEVIRRESVVRGVFCYTGQDFDAALDAVHRGALRLDRWIVEAPLGEGGAWFDRLIEKPGNVAKVLLVP